MVRDQGKVDGEQEIELSLGLSIGGAATSLKLTKEKPREIEANVQENDRSFVGSEAGDLIDPQRKREMHALRRQEAKKKREEKQQKKMKTGGFVNTEVAPARTESVDNKMLLESQQLQCRFRDREENANDALRSEHNGKTTSNGNLGSDTVNQIQNPNHNPSPNFPIMPVQYQFPQVQYVPFANGFSFPYVMPCWAPAVSSPDKNVFQPVASRAFRSFQSPDTNRTTGDVSDHNVVKRTISSLVSTGSLGSTSSSALSDYQSPSLQGGSSSSNSDTRSHSSQSPSAQPQSNVPPSSNNKEHFEHITSPHHMESTQIVSTQISKEATDKLVSNTVQSSPKENQEPISVNKHILITEDQLQPPPIPPFGGGDKGEEKTERPSGPLMPCVSTTGPNGKTISGFLYRYTKTDISIVCVCHGSSFSPAEFVKHAGGADVSHPLRHILVVPSSLG